MADFSIRRLSFASIFGGGVNLTVSPPLETVRTVEDAKEVCKQIRFCGLLQKLGFRIDDTKTAVLENTCYVLAWGTVPDRDTGDAVTASWSVYVDLPIPALGFMRRVRQRLVELMIHEVDESMLYQSVRIFDPHIPETRQPAIIIE